MGERNQLMAGGTRFCSAEAMALISWGVIAEKISGLSAMACLDVTKAGDGS